MGKTGMNMEFWNDFAARMHKDYMDNFGKQVAREAFEVGFALGQEWGRIGAENKQRETPENRWLMEERLHNYIRAQVHEFMESYDDFPEWNKELENRYATALHDTCIGCITRADNSIPVHYTTVAIALSIPDKNTP